MKHKEYECVGVNWKIVRERFEILQQEYGDYNGVTLSEEDFELIAEDMALSYSPEYDYDTALDESIDRYVENIGNE